MRTFTKEELIKKTLRSRIEEKVEPIPEGQGFFLPDLMEELDILRAGGKQIKSVVYILESLGFELSKLWDAERNVVSWFAYKQEGDG